MGSVVVGPPITARTVAMLQQLGFFLYRDTALLFKVCVWGGGGRHVCAAKGAGGKGGAKERIQGKVCGRASTMRHMYTQNTPSRTTHSNRTHAHAHALACIHAHTRTRTCAHWSMLSVRVVGMCSR